MKWTKFCGLSLLPQQYNLKPSSCWASHDILEKKHSGSWISKREQFMRISITLVLINRLKSSLVIWKVQSLLFPLLRESREKLLSWTSTEELQSKTHHRCFVSILLLQNRVCIKTFDTKQEIHDIWKSQHPHIDLFFLIQLDKGSLWFSSISLNKKKS